MPRSRTTSTCKDDKRLQRALEKWLPSYQEWWSDMGPSDFNTSDVYLRTAVGVGKGGWAHFDYVKMPDYRWGIFLADTWPPRRRSTSATTSDNRSGTRCPVKCAVACAD